MAGARRSKLLENLQPREYRRAIARAGGGVAGDGGGGGGGAGGGGRSRAHRHRGERQRVGKNAQPREGRVGRLIVRRSFRGGLSVYRMTA